MELIKIYQGNLVDARELHQFLEIKNYFRSWINRMLEYGFVENKDFFKVRKIAHPSNQKRNEYYLTITCAKEISMIQRTDRGKEARLYFIQAEETLLKLQQNKRLESFMKLEASKNRLSSNIQSIGGTHQDFIQIDLEGRKVFFNGKVLQDEILPDILLKARDFAVATTNLAFNNDITDLKGVEKTHTTTHQEVREIIENNTGIKPEEIPTEGDIKKISKKDSKKI